MKKKSDVVAVSVEEC